MRFNAIYDENDNINTDAIKALVAKYKQLGVNGIYACGSTGEGFLLSTEERMQVAEAVKEAAGDDMAVIYTSEPRPQRKRAFWHAMPKK